MMLYENEYEFREAVRATSNLFNVSEAIVEKDYFVSILLEKIAKRIPGILFKGGTSLSKCFRLIDRFSEDIDLTLDERHFSQRNKREANKTVLAICDEMGFAVRNRDLVESHGHGSYNCYEIEYPRSKQGGALPPVIRLEMVFIQKSFPNVMSTMNSMIGEALKTDDNKELMKEMGLAPFEINVQSIERTFVDKVFAICDYYLRGESLRRSRHIYDIYKLYGVIDKSEIKQLISEVRADRRKNKTCLSAMDGQDINEIIKKIIKGRFYKADYEKTTKALLSKQVDYNNVIDTLIKISDSDLFSASI